MGEGLCTVRYCILSGKTARSRELAVLSRGDLLAAPGCMGVYFKTVYRDGTTSPEWNEVVALVVDSGEWKVVEYRCLPCEDLAKRAAK